MIHRIILILYFFITLGLPKTYAQSPDAELTNKQLRQQKKELKQQSKKDNQLFKEQLTLKSDSIKIAATLQFRNTPNSSSFERSRNEDVKKYSIRNAEQYQVFLRWVGDKERLCDRCIICNDKRKMKFDIWF